MAYKDDSDHAIDVLKEIADQLMSEEPYHSAILAPLDVMGVDQLGGFAVLIKEGYVAHALLRAVFALLRTPGVHTSVNAAR